MMDHTAWPALLAAVIAEPDDDTIRLVAADFLEEQGDGDRAAFIRIQVELARLHAMGEGKSLEADLLRAKERAFLGPLSLDWKFWAAEACPELVKMPSKGGGRDPLKGMTFEGAERLTWRRGFVEAVTCPAGTWLRHGLSIRKRQPIRLVHLSEIHWVTRDDWYGMIVSLRGLEGLAVEDGEVGFVKWLSEWLPEVKVSAPNPHGERGA